MALSEALVVLSFRVGIGPLAEGEEHDLGNIADDIWPERMALQRYWREDDRLLLQMTCRWGRPFRKKERDELLTRLSVLKKKMPGLDPKLGRN